MKHTNDRRKINTPQLADKILQAISSFNYLPGSANNIAFKVNEDLKITVVCIHEMAAAHDTWYKIIEENGHLSIWLNVAHADEIRIFMDHGGYSQLIDTR